MESKSGFQGRPSWRKLAAGLGVAAVFVLAACEVIIMISPFAFFFYSVFSPIFQFLAAYAATKWMTAFFLPHMILPPTFFLQALRILGSVLFVAGLGMFAVCAGQVYLGKIFKWGIASRGIYRYIRHPQYLALTVWGLGMAILWPRFFVLVTLAAMMVMYYFLARDEERRMLNRYGDSYARYMEATGMFLPGWLDRLVGRAWESLVPNMTARAVLIPVATFGLVIGTGFLLRSVTLHSLPVASSGNLTMVAILPEDGQASARLAGVLAAEAGAGKIDFLKDGKSYLGYVMPADYIMQGMIADTGGHFHLFKRHHTMALISEWVLHPFAHLRSSPAAHMAAMHGADPTVARRHHCPLKIDDPGMSCDACGYRRVIFLEIEPTTGAPVSGIASFALNQERTPAGFIDVETSSGKIVQAQPVPRTSAWKDVPTPEI